MSLDIGYCKIWGHGEDQSGYAVKMS